MDIKLLGTAAFEGIPALFCRCDVCIKSRELGGKNIRKRSSMLLDNTILFDFTSDILWYVHNYKLDLFNLEYLFVTHSHSDHFNYFDLEAKLKWYANEGNPPLNVYAGDVCIDIVESMAKTMGKAWERFDERLVLNKIQPYSQIKIKDYLVTALPARHPTCYGEEKAFIYLVTHNGKSLLYGNDSAFFYDEVFDYLKDTYLNCIILDCTNGHLQLEPVSHMGFEDNIKVIDILREKNIVDDKTVKISTHFSHNGGIIYDVDEPKFREKGIIMAYDGMEISI